MKTALLCALQVAAQFVGILRGSVEQVRWGFCMVVLLVLCCIAQIWSSIDAAWADMDLTTPHRSMRVCISKR